MNDAERTSISSDALISTCRRRAADKVLYDLYVAAFKDKASQDLEQFMQDYFPKNTCGGDLDMLRRKEDQQYTRNYSQLTPQDTVGLMVTFSPSEECNFTVGSLTRLALKVCKRHIGIKSSGFVLEQRGETEEEMGMGAHFHALIELDKTVPAGERARETRRIKDYLKRYRTTTDHFLEIKAVSAKSWPNKVAYCHGEKQEEKGEKLRIDEIWRGLNNVPYYFDVVQ